MLLVFQPRFAHIPAMPSPSRRAITQPAQLRALALPARQEILDILATTGPASAAELARLIRRPADGLYYHLRELRRAGLVVPAGERRRGSRPEALYRTFHRAPALRHDPSPRGNSAAVTAIVASMLRLGIRDFRRAAASPDVVTHGPRRELWAIRATGWLFPSELAEVNRRMRALRGAVVRPSRSGAGLYGITILLTPLERARKKQRRPRSARRRPVP